MQLYGSCFTAVRHTEERVSAGDFRESERIAVGRSKRCVNRSCSFPPLIPNNSRDMHEIERTLRRGASMSRTWYNTEKPENPGLEVQRPLVTLNSQSSPPDENFCTVEHGLRSTPDGLHGAVVPSPPEEGVLLPSFTDLVRNSGWSSFFLIQHCSLWWMRRVPLSPIIANLSVGIGIDITRQLGG